MAGEYIVDQSKSSISVKFPTRPSVAFREILKDAGYKWDAKNQTWRASYSPACVKAAQRVAEPARVVPQDDRPTRFKFGSQLDAHQKQAIIRTEGPMLVVAGPGAGKTSTMVKRIAFLVLERNVAPEHIMVATFSRKAAKELLTRISNEFAGLVPPVNVEKMRIGTFHSLCQKILSEYADRAGLKNFTVLEDFDQKFMVQNSAAFKELRDARIFPDLKSWDWYYAQKFIECSNTLTEEQVDIAALAQSGAAHASELAHFIQAYHDVMSQSGKLDYADIQAYTLNLLRANPDVLDKLRQEIQYIIVDEYQDTNFIQEQLVLLLAGSQQNVCVVGDDDQSLYRFRGATVQNILQFEQNFEGAEKTCHRVDMVTNYRSQRDIVTLCKRWMAHTPGYVGDPTWRGCRYHKDIQANPHFPADAINPLSVVRCAAERPSDWHERMLQLIHSLQQSSDFKDFNQIAFICNSLKAKKIRDLIAFFERHGIRVNAPRANMFFTRDEVLSALGCLISCFPSCDEVSTYAQARMIAQKLCVQNAELNDWVTHKRHIHTKNGAPHAGFDYAFSGLFYEMMRFQPFAGWLNQSDAMDLASTAAARNLSLLALACTRFEANEDYLCFTARSIESMPLRFFKKYLGGIIDKGDLEEYEDEREYAPSGCVSFLTVHQAKGMEFPVVVVCSLHDEPWDNREPLIDVIRSLNTRRQELEPADDREKFDFWRKYYTAFSRAQDLLVLTSCGKAPKTDSWSVKDPSNAFTCIYDDLPDVAELDFKHLHLREVKPVNIMRTYSFTSDVAMYQACPRRYKLIHELGFPQSSGQSLLFGTLVHQCVEDIHRIVKRKRDAGEDVSRLYIEPDDVRAIVSANRCALERAENVQLKSDERHALRQVMKYLKHSKSIWRDVVEPEAAVSEVRDGFILKGVIDLIHGDDDCVEIVDFKTGKIPTDRPKLMEKYQQQMLVYTHLVRTQLGCEVSGAKLYFTSDSADNPVIDVSVSERDVTDILSEFDDTVANIEAHKFSELAEDINECKDCPFMHYCRRA